MPDQRKRRREYHPLTQAAQAAAVGTITTVGVEGAIGLGLREFQRYPELLLVSLAVTALISISAITQYVVFLRRWQIGLTVACLGALAFTGLSWFPVNGLFPNLPLDAVRSWSLALSWGAIFGGLGWVLTSLVIHRFRSDPTHEAGRAEVPASASAPVAAGPRTVTPFVPVPPISSAHLASPAPQNFSDDCYVIFCRIDRLTVEPVGATNNSVSPGYVPLKTGEAAASVQGLAKATGQLKPPCRTYTSPYGRVVLVEPSIQEALRVATELLKECAKAGVQLAVGVTYGRVEFTQDLYDHNVAGPVVNRAARLAHLSGGAGRVALDQPAHKWVEDAAVPEQFSVEQQHEKVKNMDLEFYWLEAPRPTVGCLEGGEQFVPVTSHVVVYDVADFSGQESIELGRTVNDLRRAVSDSLGTLMNRSKYAPAGDGGVVVFGKAHDAWTFATKLLRSAKAYTLKIRVGLTTGSVVFVDDNYPVGRGIFEADELSALPKPRTDCVCVSEHFWKEAYGGTVKQKAGKSPAYELWWGEHREDGQVERIDDKKALILIPRPTPGREDGQVERIDDKKALIPIPRPTPGRGLLWILPVFLVAVVVIGAIVRGGLSRQGEEEGGKESGHQSAAIRLKKLEGVEDVMLKEPVNDIAFSPNGEIVATQGGYDGVIRLWDANTLKTHGELREGMFHCLAFKAPAKDDKKTLLAAAGKDGILRLWDVSDPIHPERLPGFAGAEGSKNLNSLAFAGEAGQFVVAAGNEQAFRWNRLEAEEKPKMLMGITGDLSDKGLCGNTRHFLIGGKDGVLVWNASAGREQKLGNSANVGRVAISPSGKFALSGHAGRSVRMWNLENGKMERSFKEEKRGEVYGVAFDPTGELVVVCTHDGFVLFWNAATGKSCGTVQIANKPLKVAVFSPDGSRLLCGGEDCTLRLRTVDRGK